VRSKLRTLRAERVVAETELASVNKQVEAAHSELRTSELTASSRDRRAEACHSVVRLVGELSGIEVVRIDEYTITLRLTADGESHTAKLTFNPEPLMLISVKLEPDVIVLSDLELQMREDADIAVLVREIRQRLQQRALRQREIEQIAQCEGAIAFDVNGKALFAVGIKHGSGWDQAILDAGTDFGGKLEVLRVETTAEPWTRQTAALDPPYDRERHWSAGKIKALQAQLDGSPLTAIDAIKSAALA